MPKAKKETKQVPTVKAQECFKVVDQEGNTIRVYDVETHGAEAKELAHQFADKVNAKVI